MAIGHQHSLGGGLAVLRERGSVVKAADRGKPQGKSAALLGVGLDNDDGHTRITRGKNFFLCGGSQDTHAVMQETAIKINEHLDTRGKRLDDVSVGELKDICHEVSDSIHGSGE